MTWWSRRRLLAAVLLLPGAPGMMAEPARDSEGGRALLEHLPVRFLEVMGEPEVRTVVSVPDPFTDRTIYFRLRARKADLERALAASEVLTGKLREETRVFWRETDDTVPRWMKALEGREGAFLRFGDAWVRDGLGVHLSLSHFPEVVDGFDTFGKIEYTYPPTNGTFPRKRWAGRRPAAGEWKKHVIKPPGKGMVNTAVAHDWDGDGRMDVISSYDGKVVLLRGPDWEEFTLHEFRAGLSRIRPRNACIHSAVMDVDGDGDLDFCGSNQTVFWLECPTAPFGLRPWVYRTIDDEILGTHCLLAGDVNRDGRPDLIANSGRDAGQTTVPHSLTWLEVPENPRGAVSWVRHVFGHGDAPGGSHYAGLGDANGDGRPDIAFAAKGGEGFPGGEWFAWWEQPEDPTGPWEKHLLADGQVGATNILPADLNGDGALDYLASRGHGEGVLWFKGPTFELIEIDAEIRYPHSLVVADLDGDGDQDGATCSKDPGGHAAWYENDGQGGFLRHTIGANQGCYDLRAVDMDSDADLDLLVAGHSSNNIVWFENPGP